MTIEVISNPVQVEIINNPLAVAITIEPIAVEIVGGIQGPPGTSSGLAYRQSFTEGSLTIAGLLVVSHNLNNLVPLSIAIFDANGEQVYPDNVEVVSANALTINMESFRPLQGTYNLSIGA